MLNQAELQTQIAATQWAEPSRSQLGVPRPLKASPRATLPHLGQVQTLESG
jgi:hypothetical protein